MHIHVKTKELRSSDCINYLYNKDVAYEINRARFKKKNWESFFSDQIVRLTKRDLNFMLPQGQVANQRSHPIRCDYRVIGYKLIANFET